MPPPVIGNSSVPCVDGGVYSPSLRALANWSRQAARSQNGSRPTASLAEMVCGTSVGT
ncbi:hypothetical protein MCHI_002027 [Candidatus Magnetoovum chiemensis]|nr:hypothetical protein MCHI_002027 [Candidatus Magnetoovum chiemensis]